MAVITSVSSGLASNPGRVDQLMSLWIIYSYLLYFFFFIRRAIHQFGRRGRKLKVAAIKPSISSSSMIAPTRIQESMPALPRPQWDMVYLQQDWLSSTLLCLLLSRLLKRLLPSMRASLLVWLLIPLSLLLSLILTPPCLQLTSLWILHMSFVRNAYKMTTRQRIAQRKSVVQFCIYKYIFFNFLF